MSVYAQMYVDLCWKSHLNIMLTFAYVIQSYMK